MTQRQIEAANLRELAERLRASCLLTDALLLELRAEKLEGEAAS